MKRHKKEWKYHCTIEKTLGLYGPEHMKHISNRDARICGHCNIEFTVDENRPYKQRYFVELFLNAHFIWYVFLEMIFIVTIVSNWLRRYTSNSISVQNETNEFKSPRNFENRK